MFKRTKKSLLTNWTSEQVFQDPLNIFKAMIKDIHQAKHTVELEMYIFDIDELGTQILNALAEAVSKGVKVRLLVDGFGSPDFTPQVTQKIKAQGIDIKIYHPWTRFWKRVGRLFYFHLKNFFKELAIMNFRNHRKVCIVDHQIAWAGSANVSMSFFDWRETMVRVTGPAVENILTSFNWLWQRVEVDLKSPTLPTLINPNHYDPFGKWRRDRFRINLINHAQKRVWLATAYFIPPSRLLWPLIKAARRGVEVEVLTSHKHDHWLITLLIHTYYGILLKNKIKVYEFKDRFMHAKVLIVDDKAIVGSSNYNHRSFQIDLEIDLLLTKPETLTTLGTHWKADIKNSLQITQVPRLWTRLVKMINFFKKIS